MPRQHSKPRYFIFILLLLFIVPAGALQTYAASKIKSHQWQHLTNDPEFGYKSEKEMEVVKEDPPPDKSNFFADLIESFFKFLISDTGRVLIWALVIAAIGYLIYKIILKEHSGLFARKAKKQDSEETGDGDPDDIADGNWELLMQQALKKGDMRAAIRFGYLLVLQNLQQTNLIQYRADKTNYDYTYELKNSAIRQHFRQITRQYEFAWYGNYPVSPEKFESYTREMNALKAQIYR